MKSLVLHSESKISNRKVIVVPMANKLVNDDSDKVQETIWRLRDEVRKLQEELARTRRALEQREVLLRNSLQREIELHTGLGEG